MKKLNLTDEAWIVSPVNSNLVINQENECICIVMSKTWNGLAFTPSREKKQQIASLISEAPKMLSLLSGLKQRMSKDLDTTHLGKVLEQNYKELYDYLIEL